MKVFFNILISVCILISCSNNKVGYDNSAFNEQDRILELEFSTDTDLYLKPILNYVQIHKQGYGILLNIEGAVSYEKQETLINDFRKNDVNAIHVFNVGKNILPRRTQIAIEGAQFVWLIAPNATFHGTTCDQLKKPLKKLTENGGIIVVEKGIDKSLINCLSK